MLEGLLIERIPNDAPYPNPVPRADTARSQSAQSAESRHAVGDARRLQLPSGRADLHDAR